MRDVVVLSVALVASLTWAYVVWTDDSPEVDVEAVDLYQASEADVTRIAYTSDTLTVVAERRADANGPYVWVESTEKKVKKAKPSGHPDAGHPDEAEGEEHGHEEPAAPEGAAPGAPEAPAEEVEIKRASFMAGAAGDDLWKAFAPLQAMRELPMPADKASYGLDAPKATIEITRASGPLTLAMGGETFGAKDRYVEVGGKVYLLDDAKTKTLEHAANQLVERSLYPQVEGTIDRVTVSSPAGEVAMVQKNKEDPKAASWANAATPDTPDDSAKAWIKKLLSVKLREYVLPDEAPQGLQPVARFAVTGEGKTWGVEILRDNGEPAKWYARSEYDRALVSLTELPIREVVDDLPSFLGTPE